MVVRELDGAFLVGDEVVDVVQNVPPNVLKVTPQEAAFFRNVVRIVEFLCLRLGKKLEPGCKSLLRKFLVNILY